MTKKNQIKNQNKNQIKKKLFPWPVTTIDNRIWHFGDTFKYESVSRAWSLSDCFEILNQNTLVY